MTDRIDWVSIDVFGATPDTRWCFVTVATDGGKVGYGEATLQRHEAMVLSEAVSILGGAVGGPAEPPLIETITVGSLPRAAVRSALSQALWDLEAKGRGVPLAAALGGNAIAVPVYANINRRTRDRSPDGFVRSARAAVAAGHSAIKIAPFDEVERGRPAGWNGPDRLEQGLARIGAVRAEIGPDRDLMVDCHWRLDRRLAEEVLRQGAQLGLYWVECPLPESSETLEDLARLRGLANGKGIRLAGCELGVGIDAFELFVSAGAYDVIMPDIKYIGSIEEMLRLAERVRAAGVTVSPHNPAGPISHAASLHVCAAAEGAGRLEMQFDETPLFDALVGGELPAPREGIAAVPAGSGLGVAIASDVLARYRLGGARYGKGARP